MDLGIVVPRLEGRDGAESYLRSCLERWQPHLHLTLYTADSVHGREADLGIDPARTAVVTLPASREAPEFPASWASHMRDHDAYLFLETPPPPPRFQPSVWCKDDRRGPRQPDATPAGRSIPGGRSTPVGTADDLLMRLCRAARRTAP